MSKTLSIYFPLKVSELDALVEEFKKEFDELIRDSFSDDELEHVEKKLDALAAIYVSPVLAELTFDDFDADETLRSFFSECRSVLLLENLPYLETNPFQVSWLRLFLKKFSDCLVDPGGLSALLPKKEYLDRISRLRGLEELLTPAKPVPPPPQHGISAPVLPIDFLILDVYRELDRLKGAARMQTALDAVAETDRPRRLFTIMKEGRLDANSLLKLSGMNPKEFDDNLEKLKFLLKKI